MSFKDKPREMGEEDGPVPRFEILSQKKRDAIHQASLEVLGEAGVKVASEEALEVLAAGGCRVEAQDQMVRFPAQVIEEALENAPGKILLASRDAEHDYLMGGRTVGYTNFGEGTQVFDPETGELRTSTLNDVALTARLCDALEMTATYERAVAPNDAPDHAHDVYAFEACLKNTTKHIHIGANSGEHAKRLFQMAAAVQGGYEELRRRPILSLNTCPTSPLQLHTTTAEVIMESARHGVAVNVLSMAMSGASAPLTLAGTLVTHNSEVLAGIVLNQLTSPGAPVIYGSSTTTFDMTHATAPVGAPELALISAAVAEMSDYYWLPCWVAGG
jgi:trimethylamine---corrinoid protein Co-methyltransferase